MFKTHLFLKKHSLYMNNKIADACVNILKRDDVKNEVKVIFAPLVNLILIKIYPYIYLSLIFVIISFLLHLGIFYLMLKKNNVCY